MLIPNPTGFLVLNVIRILVQAFLASHSSLEGFGEFYGVSVVGVRGHSEATQDTLDISGRGILSKSNV